MADLSALANGNDAGRNDGGKDKRDNKKKAATHRAPTSIPDPGA
jgi:hypothetical protein